MEDIQTGILAFIYTLSHWIGEKVADIIHSITDVTVPLPIVDAIGILVILTIFLFIAEVAKKIAWMIVIIGWVLILLRIGLLMIG